MDLTQNEKEPHVFIKELRTNEELIGTDLTGVYYCKSAQLVTRTNKKPYYSLVLSDKTGEIAAKLSPHQMKEAIEDREITITGFVSMNGGKVELELHTVHAINMENITSNEKEEIHAELVCGISMQFASEQAWRLKHLIETMSEPYKDCALSFVKTQVANDLSQLPASIHDSFSYNGGLLDKLVLSVQLADSILQTELPANAYTSVPSNRDVVLLGLICSCVCQCGKFSSFPDGTENRMTNGYHYLISIIQSLQSYNESVDSDAVINCIRYTTENAEYGITEAKICKQILMLADTLAYSSYANFAGLPVYSTKKGE